MTKVIKTAKLFPAISGVFFASLLMVSLCLAERTASDLVLRIESSKKVYKLGEPIGISYFLENISSRPVIVADPTVVPYPIEGQSDPLQWGVHCAVRDSRGHETIIVRFDEYQALDSYASFGHFKTLAPQEEITGVIDLFRRKESQIKQWAIYRPQRHFLSGKDYEILNRVFAKPGNYAITVFYSNATRQYEDDQLKLHAVDSWVGTVASGQINVEIVP